MVKVLISDKMSPRAAEIFAARGIEVDSHPGSTPEELAARIGEYDALVIRSATKVTADLLASASRLKVVGRAGIGVDNVDIAAATGRGVIVMNTPFGNSVTTAEHAISLLMALSRQIPQADRSTQAGKWEKSRFMGVEVAGKTLGLIGCGNIGSIVADRAQGLKMKVVTFDPYLSQDRAADLAVEKVELEELLERSDFISLHTPLTDTTRNILNVETLAKTRKGVRIINCARGGLVDEQALTAALESGQVAGAAFDVFVSEPAKENPLFGKESFIATPHLGASTSEAQENVAIQVAEQISDYLLTGAVTNALNMPSVTAEEAPRLKPYMKLAEQLGSFAGQLVETGLTEISVEYEGHAASLNARPLTAVVLQGVLAPLMDSVNMVNAPVVAKERDIDVQEIKHDRPCDYHALIRITVTTEAGKRCVSGTIFANQPRITEIDGISIEAEVGPHVLYVKNEDRPGFIGGIGAILADAQINIATFHLGRSGPGDEALALISVDQDVPQAILGRVSALPQVVDAKALRF